MRRVFFILAVAVILNLPSLAVTVQYDQKNGVLTIGNKLIERQYNTKDRFYPTAIIDKRTGQKCIGDLGENWFEIGINEQVVSSAKYMSHNERQMAHGGTEVTVQLKTDQININYIVEIFPNSPITRERLEFISEQGVDLSDIDGKARLVFPRYNFKNTVKAQEIKLASWAAEQMADADINAYPVMRDWGSDKGINLSQCHMYHPVVTDFVLSSSEGQHKGPIVIGSDGKGVSWLIAYEHGSADEMEDFLVIGTKSVDSGTIAEVKAVRGAYIDGEKITEEKPYKTQWIDVGVVCGDIEDAKAAMWEFLYKWQSEKSIARKPSIYYNTWGWQVDDKREKDIKTPDILKNEKRVLEEIDYAHQIGADIFVLDDGWFDYPGDWNINRDAFPDGFTAIKEKLDGYGMRLGLWMAAFYVHPKSKIIKEHPEWIKKSKDGKFAKAKNKNWGLMACQVSGYSDYLVSKCKGYMDMGVSYFKWDGMESNACYADHHKHGGKGDVLKDRADRYGFEIINYITDAARRLTEIDPNLIIVYDVTEKNRNVGLEFLSVGRYFWMNNGGSFYGDLSSHRAKSMRTVANLYARIIPQLLQSYANYPHNKVGYLNYGAMSYNVCNSFLGGNGFWGDLSETSDKSRKEVNELVTIYKSIASSGHSVRPIVTGKVGSSPEIYEYLDAEEAQGQVIAFSGSILKYTYFTKKINTDKLLGVLQHRYEVQDGRIKLDFEFTEPEAVRAVFVLGQNNFGGQVEKSSCWLKEIKIEGNSLNIVNGAPGKITVFWPKESGSFELKKSDSISYTSTRDARGSSIEITVGKAGEKITIIKGGKKLKSI